MFSNQYQNGLYIELFNTQSNINFNLDKDMVKTWKFQGKISKEYDSQLKGYINILNNAGASKMQLPSNEKNALGIVQNYVVFQLFIFSPKLFNIEITITDTMKV
jgi:hypothetical protein